MVYGTKKARKVRAEVKANQPKVKIQGLKEPYKGNDNGNQSGNQA